MADTPLSGLLEGKTGLVFGVANRRSIAWGIAQALAGAGATLAFTYQGERIEAGVRELAASVNGKLVLPCDVTRDEDLDSVFDAVGTEFGGLDILIHAVAFAAREDLEGRFTDTTRANFAMAIDISAYSLTAMVQRAEPLMEARGGGSVVTMTYLGGERAVQNYNVMGVAKAALDASVRYLAMDLGQKNIRVNAISAGPIRTLAARSISGFTVMEEHYERRAPMRRNVDASEVGQTALFLCSPMASGITGEIVHVDAGYHSIGF
jgi:enoyl-[acyl-carrier protein] reductase I